MIGGHGSALGARVLADAVPVAFVPATIDHDVEGTGATIGMDSAIGFALVTIDQLRVTGRSLPGRAFLVETLGAPRGYLADAVAQRRPASTSSSCPSVPSTSTRSLPRSPTAPRRATRSR